MPLKPRKVKGSSLCVVCFFGVARPANHQSPITNLPIYQFYQSPYFNILFSCGMMETSQALPTIGTYWFLPPHPPHWGSWRVRLRLHRSKLKMIIASLFLFVWVYPHRRLEGVLNTLCYIIIFYQNHLSNVKF